MAGVITYSICDVVKEALKLPQTVLGLIPDFREFLRLADDDIRISPGYRPIGPIWSSYPNEIYIEFRATPNGIFVPMLSSYLKHYQSEEKISRKENREFEKDPHKFNMRLLNVGLEKIRWLKENYRIDAQMRYSFH